MSTPTPTTLPELFLRAAHLIALPAEAGLPLLRCKLDDGAGRHCTAGAIRVAAGLPATEDNDLTAAAILFLSERVESQPVSAAVIAAVGDSPEMRVADWHDRPGRTPAEVVAALLHAARDAAPPSADAQHLAVQRHNFEYGPQWTGQAVTS